MHHLVPRARGGNHGPTARLCSTCHRQVHAMFSETTLAEELYSVELLRANPSRRRVPALDAKATGRGVSGSAGAGTGISQRLAVI